MKEDEDLSTRSEKRKEKHKRRWPYWVGGILILLITLGVGYAVHIYNTAENAVETMNEPLARDSNPEQKQKIDKALKEKETINVLLLGVDERSNDGGRSDTMIFISLNPNTDSMLMFSIPRDTYVTIPGRLNKDKINHAYAFGGTQLAVETVEEFLDVPIHFYAKVNMEGFKDGVDALGGVTVNNQFKFSYDNFTFEKGEIELNGTQALAYSRMRKEDPRGDFGRNDRQRQVVEAAIKEAASFSSFTNITELLGIVGDNVKTNMEMNNMQDLFINYLGVQNNQKSLQIEGHSSIMNSIWYWIVPEEQLTKIRTTVKDHMEEK
ncbi:LCP family protein [Bacillaceae bacterium S4-13-58]